MRPIRLLVCDDEPNVLVALVALFAACTDVEVVGTATDTPEAVSEASRLTPDVVLIDVKMPGGGGPVAASAIAHSLPLTRIVALSAHDDRTTVLAMLAAGAVGYIVKGSPFREIHDAVIAAAASKQSLSPDVEVEVISELTARLDRDRRQEAAREIRRARIRTALEPEARSIAFQPIVRLADRQTIGFEALSRFSLEPVHAPDWWFAEARKVGLQGELEAAALSLALQDAERIPATTFVSVNLSPASLASPVVLDILTQSPCERVVLELTEHAPVLDYAALKTTLEALSARGLRIAIDDLGAGFASLRHVVQLAPDMLKLDISLTAGVEADRMARAMISAFVALAQSTAMLVIAEGIETESRAEILGNLGVGYGQGYLFGRPAAL